MRTRSDHFRRGSTAYNEVTKILGAQCREVLDESVRQVNCRWLKASFLVPSDDGGYRWYPGADGVPVLITRRRRVRIPRTSPLARSRA